MKKVLLIMGIVLAVILVGKGAVTAIATVNALNTLDSLNAQMEEVMYR